jgi:hypothetical protein
VTTTYTSKWANLPENETDLAHVQAAPSGRKRFWTKKKIVAGGIAAAVLVPTAAWAAVTLFGFGDFNAAAATPGTLNIVGTPTTTKTLAPGTTVGVTGNVQNPNDYAVSVTGIIVKNSTFTVTGGSASECKVGPASGGTTTTFPKEGSTAAIANGGTQYNLAAPVNVPANSTVTVTVPNVITQDASATAFCGVTAHYAVAGTVGS